MSAQRLPTVVWWFRDGKAGHDNQARGLIDALQRLIPLDVHEVPLPPLGRLLVDAVTGRFGAGRALPDPALLIGAGHGTHPALLAARRARGGRAVVLMKPSLPRAWFDLCVIPRHDGVAPAPNVLITDGVLNAIPPAVGKDPHQGLILIGGPSAHHGWSETELLAQLRVVLARDTGIQWRIAGSRRTPASTAPLLRALAGTQVQFIAHEDTDAAWLPAQLARAAVVWVTEDSMSMLYEALTAGAATGLLAVPRRRADRVTRAIDALIEAERVTPFDVWQKTHALRLPEPFNEAARIAAWIERAWLSEC